MGTRSATSWLDTFAAAFCEFGNSRLKLYWQQQVFTLSYAQDTQWADRSAALLAASPSPLLLFIATVAPQRTAVLLSKLRQQSAECFVCWLHNLLPPSNPLLPYEGVHGIGIDRLLGLLGARRSFAPPLMTVDCGTAITVNVLSADGRCLGGAIFANTALQIQALATATALVPAVPAPSNVTLRIGQTTQEALWSGTFASVLGGVQHLIESFSAQLSYSTPPAVIITGGGGTLLTAPLQQWWKGMVSYRPYLVLEGMQMLVEQCAPEELQLHVQPLEAVTE